MTDTHETSVEKHRYLIHLIWSINDEEHGHGHALHHVTEGEAEGPWDPRSYIQEFVQTKHPQWLPHGTGRIGWLNEKVVVHSVTVHRITESDTAAWEAWLGDAVATRNELDQKRNYEADMATIKALQMKWGLGESASEAKTTGEEEEVRGLGEGQA